MESKNVGAQNAHPVSDAACGICDGVVVYRKKGKSFDDSSHPGMSSRMQERGKPCGAPAL